MDVGYHYTKSSSLGLICTNGLMNRTERITDSVTADFHGSSFGKGIYTANNPCAFKYYGGVGLLVARMKGDTEQWSRRTREPYQSDTVVGNKNNNDFLGYD